MISKVMELSLIGDLITGIDLRNWQGMAIRGEIFDRWLMNDSHGHISQGN